MLKYAILSVSLITVMAGAMIAPAVASIATAFPQATAFQINLLTSLHAGMVVPFSFVSGYLARYYSKKYILIVSLILYLIGGLGGRAVHRHDVHAGNAGGAGHCGRPDDPHFHHADL